MAWLTNGLRTSPGDVVSPSISNTMQLAPRNARIRRLHWWYNAILWGLLALLLLAHAFGVIWSTVVLTTDLFYGREPALGVYNVPGLNDDPFTDRAVACARSGRTVIPVQLSQLLAKAPAGNRTGIDGYRVIPRTSFTMDASKIDVYGRLCRTYAMDMDTVLATCQELGYNVTRDFLRVVHGLTGDTITDIPETLPVLIIPVWDRSPLTRTFIPGHDGRACLFQLFGSLSAGAAADTASYYLSAASRKVVEAKTEQLLRLYNGSWRNGWYEDPFTRSLWYSVLATTNPVSIYDIDRRVFDLRSQSEVNCSAHPQVCDTSTAMWSWGENIYSSIKTSHMESIVITNGTRHGLFVFRSHSVETTRNTYNLKVLIANFSLLVLLARWAVALIALYPHDSIGIAALANSWSFHVLPVALYPRFKLILVAFWSAGCVFEGNQRALGDTWCEIYPAIGELLLCYFSVLNLVAKILRRRCNDSLFGPTLVFFGVFHWSRSYLANLDWFGFDSRVGMAVTSEELDAASTLDFFTSDLAFRTNGKVKVFFIAKLVVLAVNLLCVLAASRKASANAVKEDTTRQGVETVLAIQFQDNGGLGSTAPPYVDGGTIVREYEVVRAGFVAVGGSKSPGKTSSSRPMALVSIGHFYWLLATRPVRWMRLHLVRVVVFFVTATPSDSGGSVSTLAAPVIISTGDERLSDVSTRLSAIRLG